MTLTQRIERACREHLNGEVLGDVCRRYHLKKKHLEMILKGRTKL